MQCPHLYSETNVCVCVDCSRNAWRQLAWQRIWPYRLQKWPSDSWRKSTLHRSSLIRQTKNQTMRISKWQTHHKLSKEFSDCVTPFLPCSVFVKTEIWGVINHKVATKLFCDQCAVSLHLSNYSFISLTHTNTVFRIHLFTVCFTKTAKYPGGREWRRPRVSVTLSFSLLSLAFCQGPKLTLAK